MASFKDYINKVKAVTGIGRFTESMRKGRELAAQRKAREAREAGELPDVAEKTRSITGSIRARNKALADLDE